jgi:hypothetical protein
MSNAVQKNAAWPRTDAFDYSTAGLFLFFLLFLFYFSWPPLLHFTAIIRGLALSLTAKSQRSLDCL